MAAPKEQTEAQIAHQALLDEIDIHSIHKSFRNPSWRPNQRRNKNIKTILGDASRREASAMATPQQDDNSGAGTPAAGQQDDGLSTSGTSTPATGKDASGLPPNLAQASRSLSKLVLEKSLKPNGGAAPATRLRYHDKEVFGLIRTLPQGAAEQFLEARGAHTVLK
uniref:Major facilitator superfamily transporter quinate n=1 Tax=Colletotrichum fructicola (strain Nara gc5) TaxID=1213859 RepID=L2FSA6_COLFN